tara:strand:+ start:206 stop:538 length:333 start_codon:yes stop_codon:yes gene_type:complete
MTKLKQQTVTVLEPFVDNTTNLKFANLANLGDEIKAYDFDEKRTDGDCFVQGIVLDKGELDRGYGCYQIRMTKKVWNGFDVTNKTKHSIFYIPFEVDLFEFDNRVQKVGK